MKRRNKIAGEFWILTQLAVFLFATCANAVEFGGSSATITNAYFPMKEGMELVYVSYGFDRIYKGSLRAESIETVDGVKCLKIYNELTYTYVWLAQDSGGNVWCLKVLDVGFGDQEFFGREDPALVMPSDPKVGDVLWGRGSFVEERIVKSGLTIGPLGTGLGPFENCIKTKLDLGEGDVDRYYYAPGMGVVWVEINDDGVNGLELKKVAYTIGTVGIIAPSSLEVIPSGSQYTLEWEAPLDAVFFTLKYSLNEGRTWRVIEKDVVGDFYEWTVPTPKKTRRRCFIKVIGYDEYGKKVCKGRSELPFTVEVLTVDRPYVGAQVYSGTTYRVEWTTYGTRRPVEITKIFLTKNGGNKWVRIVTLPGNPGYFDWFVNSVNKEKTKCKIKVVLKDSAGVTVAKGVNFEYFTIYP